MNWLKRLFKLPSEPKEYELVGTYKQKLKDCYIGQYKQDIDVTGFLYRVTQNGRSWCEVEMALPTFKPFWDHEYDLIRMIEATGKEMEAQMKQDYYKKYGNIEYRF